MSLTEIFQTAMNSKTSIVGMLVVSAALLGAAGSASAAIHAQTALSSSAGLSVDAMAFRGSPSAMGASISTAAVAAGAGVAGSNSNASALGAAAATREEALPTTNLAMLLLAALAAMGSIVIRRSGNH